MIESTTIRTSNITTVKKMLDVLLDKHENAVRMGKAECYILEYYWKAKGIYLALDGMHLLKKREKENIEKRLYRAYEHI